jgi:hypothetical protein
MALAYTVLKTPQGDGTYTIVMQAGCGAIACLQDPWQASANFTAYVLRRPGTPDRFTCEQDCFDRHLGPECAERCSGRSPGQPQGR